MTKKSPALAIATLVLTLSLSAFAQHDHGRPHDQHDEHDEHEEHAAPLSPEEIARHGVVFEVAGPGTIDLGLELPGEIRPNPERLAHLAPRFRGVVRSVRVRIGDPVREGQTLAVIEGENLATFEVKASFAGTVIDCHIVAGEVVSPDAPAFVVADLTTVWVSINVYQQDFDRVRVGQQVRIVEGEDRAVDAEIAYINPIVDQATRTALARVVLDNSDGRWRPGVFVTAAVLEPIRAGILVPLTALQTFEGRIVVFVAEEDHFEPRAVRLGRRGLTTVEVLDGLSAGERYVAAGSFLVKAELGKGEADHGH